MNNTEGKHELEKINFGVIPITVYRGCLVTKLIGGFEIWGNKVTTPDEVDSIIDNAGTILSESISNRPIKVTEGFSE